MDYAALARESLDRVAASKPLIHQITNVVVTNDSANLTLAFGALPVMAYAPQEVAEMAAISQALVLNIGTLSEEEIAAMLLAGMAAGEKGIPIILDPVGAGATTFRTESALRLLRELPITVLRGNRGEIGALVGSGEVRGVEATGSEDPRQVAAAARDVFGVTVAVTGQTDVMPVWTRRTSSTTGRHSWPASPAPAAWRRRRSGSSPPRGVIPHCRPPWVWPRTVSPPSVRRRGSRSRHVPGSPARRGCRAAGRGNEWDRYRPRVTGSGPIKRPARFRGRRPSARTCPRSACAARRRSFSPAWRSRAGADRVPRGWEGSPWQEMRRPLHASSGLIGLPQFDRIALRIMDAREAPDSRHIPFRVGGHRDPRRAERRAQAVEIVHAQVEHPLAIRGEIIRVGRKRREDAGPRLRLPRAVGRRAHAEMLDIPGAHRLRILRAKEESADPRHAHARLPVVPQPKPEGPIA